MIIVKNLVKKYENHTAVEDLSFCVEKGQIYGFLGPNGAGKSTTMNIITGYLAATSGTVSINGHDILKEPEEAKKSIGYLPELPPVYAEMTVHEYLKFVAELKKIPKAERKKEIEEVMERCMITDMKDRLIKNLSKGYKQRVGLAQAIIGYPEVIILDEPTVGLDPKQIIEIRDLIRSLAQKHTIILSSHILSEVSAICDHIMIISNGKLVASDSPERLQELQRGKAELEIVILGEKNKIEEVLTAEEEVEKIVFEDCKEENCCKTVMTVKENSDIRESIFYTLAENKLPIMSMKYQEKTLEDIFLELTEETKVSEDIEVSEETEASEIAEKIKEEPEDDSNL